MKRCWLWLLAVIGLAGTGTGAGLVYLYIREAIIVRLGEPDQSLLFWYLPVLFLGLAALVGGLILLVYVFRRLNP